MMVQEAIKFDHYVDAKSMQCPMPLLKFKACLHGMNAGEVLRLDTLDIGSKKDIPYHVEQSDLCVMLGFEEANNDQGQAVYSFWVLKQK